MKKFYLILFLAVAFSGCSNSLRGMATVAYDTGDYDGAIANAKLALKASPKNSPDELRSLYILARSHEAKGDVYSAKYVYNMILQSYPQSPEADYARKYNSNHE